MVRALLWRRLIMPLSWRLLNKRGWTTSVTGLSMALMSTLHSIGCLLLQSYCGARLLSTCRGLGTQRASVDLAGAARVIRKAGLVEMSMYRGRRLRLVGRWTWLRWSVNDYSPLPIHRVHASKDWLLLNLRGAFNQNGRAIRSPWRWGCQCLTCRCLIFLARSWLIAGACPLTTADQDGRLLATYIVTHVLGLIKQTYALAAPLSPALGYFHIQKLLVWMTEWIEYDDSVWWWC